MTQAQSQTVKQKCVRALLWIALPLAVFWVGGSYVVKHCGYVFNYSGSMPYGLYKTKKILPGNIERGMDVLVCLPDQAITEGFKRGYLHKDKRCANGAEPLIKKIIAISGDHIAVNDQAIIVSSDGDSQRYAAPRQTDSLSGQPVKNWLTKKNFHLKQQVWVYGAYHSDYSWDSRYYGPIPNDYVLAQLVPVWVSH